MELGRLAVAPHKKLFVTGDLRLDPGSSLLVCEALVNVLGKTVHRLVSMVPVKGRV